MFSFGGQGPVAVPPAGSMSNSVLVTVVTSYVLTRQFLGQDLAVVPDYFPSLVFQSPIQFSAFLDDLLLIIIFLEFFSGGPFLKSLLNSLQYFFCFLFFFFFYPPAIWDLSSPTGDQTCTRSVRR